MTQFKNLQWVEASDGTIPNGAVVGGEDEGESLFVGRAEHNGEFLPGKVHPSHKVCYVSWGGKEHPKANYQVLVNTCGCSLVWVKAAGGDFPSGSVQGGRTADGEVLIVGRAFVEGTTCIGKVHPSHEVFYAPYGGEEVAVKEYEVLTLRALELL